LGLEYENSSLAIDMINGCREDMENGIVLGRWTREQSEAVRSLFRRPYFQRIWVVQEIIFARILTFWCGYKRLPGEVLQDFIKGLGMEDLRYLPNCTTCLGDYDFTESVLRSDAGRIMDFKAYGFSYWDIPGDDGQAQRLQELISKFSGQKSTDPRDRIYGLLGLVTAGLPATEREVITADYSKSAKEIYRDVMRVLRTSRGFLHNGVGTRGECISALQESLNVGESDFEIEIDEPYHSLHPDQFESIIIEYLCAQEHFYRLRNQRSESEKWRTVAEALESLTGYLPGHSIEY
jgi:hypothetical protein